MTTLTEQTAHNERPEACIAPSPMALVRRFTESNEEARETLIYFERNEVRGSGFGRDNPELLHALDEVRQAMVRQMPGMDFFISMIPEHYLHSENEHRTAVPETQEVPRFGLAFKAIGQLLDNHPDVKHPCDVRIEVITGREFCGSPKLPRFSLSIIERIPNTSGFGTTANPLNCATLANGKAVTFDSQGEDAKAILRWYAGAAHGLIQWTWCPARLVECNHNDHEKDFAMTTTDLNPLQNAKDNIGFVMDFLVLTAGGVVSEQVKAMVREVLLPLTETTPDLSIVSAVEAFEQVPELQEFAAQLRKAALPGEFGKYFNPDEYHKLAATFSAK